MTTTSLVQDNTLQWGAGDTAGQIAIGSAEWYAWLETATTFTFRSAQGSFTARKESRQRGGQYWKAYRRRAGKLYRFYLGKSAELNPARLAEAAATLSSRGDAAQALPAHASLPAAEPIAETASLRAARPMPAQQMPLLTTKLAIPPPQADLVPRPRLTTRLQQACTRRLTLITAPVGFGKTTLLRDWLHQIADCRL
jgi:LuxR family transcriptional regulator, maltose regulon positive regulatory protein